MCGELLPKRIHYKMPCLGQRPDRCCGPIIGGCNIGFCMASDDRLCLDVDDEEQELRALTPEEAARLRSQMEDLLKRSDEARAVSASNEEAMRYGREMWARCEALTAGVFPVHLTALALYTPPHFLLLRGLTMGANHVSAIEGAAL